MYRLVNPFEDPVNVIFHDIIALLEFINSSKGEIVAIRIISKIKIN